MIRLRPWLAAWPLVVTVAVAAAWPLSAYAVNPVVLPALLCAAGAAVLVLTRPLYGVALALALAPLTNLALGGVGVAKPFQLLLPALAIAVVVYSLLAPTEEVLDAPRGSAIAVGVFFAAALASSAQALAPSASIKKIVILLTGAALFFAVLQLCRARRDVITVAAGAVAGLLIAGGHGVAQHYLGFRGVAAFVVNGQLVNRVQGSFGHPNQYGGYLAFLIPLAVAIAVSRAFPRWARWLAVAALALGIPGLVFSYARGAIVGLALGSLVWLGLLRPRLAIVAAVAVAVAAATLAPATLRQRLDPQATREDVPLRADIWGAALDIYSQHPLLGVGVNNFGRAYTSLPSTPGFATQRRFLDNGAFRIPTHSQNLYLNVLAEEGLIGEAALLFLLGTTGVMLYRGARARDPVGRAVCLGCGAGFFAILVHSLLELTLFTELTLPFFALLGIATAVAGLDRRERAAG